MGRVWSRLVDLAPAAAVAGVLSLFVALSQTGADAPPTVAAYLFTVGFGAVLLVRRRMPIPMLVLSVLGTFAYYTWEFPPIGVALPVVAALYFVAGTGHLRSAIAAGSTVFVVSTYFRTQDEPRPIDEVLGIDAVSQLALIAAAIALGYSMRSRRLRMWQQEQISQLVMEQSMRDVELRLQTEREHISRELHDTLGHAFSVVALHASVGREALGHDEGAVGAALDRIRTQSTTSLRELRAMLRLLRTAPNGNETRHIQSLSEVWEIAEKVEAAGITVDVDVSVDGVDLPAAVDTAAYRIVQEALTNVVRHARARAVVVTVAANDQLLCITVADDGRGADAGLVGGFGISGMTERARVLGGSLTVLSAPGAGFTLDAVIPIGLR